MKNKNKPHHTVKGRHLKVHALNPRPHDLDQDLPQKTNHDLVFYPTNALQRNEDLDAYLRYQLSLAKKKLNSRAHTLLFLQRGWWKRTLSVAGFLCIFIGCLYQCCAFLKLYLLFPTTMELNVANEPVLDFPAITVCNSNPVRYQVWCQDNPQPCIRKPNETLEEISKRLAKLYDKLSKERRIELGIPYKDFVIYAAYEEEVITEPFDRYYDYEFTNCYTFNALWGNQTRHLRKADVFNPITGKSSELILCVNIDVNNYNNLSGSVVGRVMMSIHANDIVPNPTYDGASLEAGEMYSYGVQKVIILTQSKILSKLYYYPMVTTELLEYPYQTACRNYDKEKEVRTGARMSQKNCLLECYKSETEKACGCTYRRLSLMYGGTPCEFEFQNHCLLVVEDKVFQTCNPQCPMACKQIEFKYVATDSEPLRKEDPLYEKMQVNKIFQSSEEMNKNMACLRIHYGSTETRTMTYRPKYAFIELFSLLGGYSGLWLGFSLLKCYEVFLLKIADLKKKKKTENSKAQKVKKRKKYYC
ncbi:Acid-sensing ion channel 5 like protein [Argiope bruennichi]|uniref:Acid-sensing ion channel 5 like protein n=1 Tax=Argiope bruennichi TaxID=94029 RepID=A0A8T0ELW4_ARGBR|nr:Acid-sensing ion channel 5 like protein [Argiope bruennichi]